MASDPNGWRAFDPSNPPDGLCWVEVERPETWCDAGDDGRTVGGYTGQSALLVVLVEAYRAEDGPAFESVGYGDHGEVRCDDAPRRWMPILTPAEVAAAVQAEREACAKWHDQQASKQGEWRYWGGPSDRTAQLQEEFHLDSAKAIRARGDTSALDAALAQARLDAMKPLLDALNVIAAQDSGIPGSTSRADCMAAIAIDAIRRAAAGEAGHD